MLLKAALRTRALADSTVSGIVGTRIYWTQRNQGDPLPAVVFHVISDPRPQHLKGFEALRETLVQADCLGLNGLAASGLAEALIAALVPEGTSGGVLFNRSIVDAVRDDGEQTETAFIHRTSVDLRVWWRAT